MSRLSIRTGLLASVGLTVFLSGAAAAKPVQQYVKVCSLYGAGFYYVPGTDQCIKVGGWVRPEEGVVCDGQTFNPGSACVRGDPNAVKVRACPTQGTEVGYVPVGSPCPDANRAFIQFAGMTAGHAESFYDFYSAPVVTLSVGVTSTTTPTSTQAAFSGIPLTGDTTMPNSVSPSAASVTAGVGAAKDLQSFEGPDLIAALSLLVGGYEGGPRIGQYAPEDKPASGFPAQLPAKKAPAVVLGVEGNVYFFTGSHATINGIPGGPFGTATGSDSFNIKDQYLFTGGAYLRTRIAAWWSVALTGGVALVDKQITYNCVTYCAVAPATPAFSNSQDVWLPGVYVGGRLEAPLPLAPWPGSTIGFDYKHIFFGADNVTLGSAALAREVTLNVRQDMDMFMARLAVPLR